MFELIEDSFEIKRKELLKDVVNYLEKEELRKGFLRDFNAYLDELSLKMLEEGNDYFARFTSRMERRIDFSLSWPLSTILNNGTFILSINPISFLFNKRYEAIALLKHEILHIILSHHKREKVLKNNYSKLAINLAMDISVNQYLKNLPSYCQRLSQVNFTLNLEMKLNETLEYYTNEIQKAIDESRNKEEIKEKFIFENGINYEEAHDDWSSGGDLDKDQNLEKIRGIMEYSSLGGIPEELKTLFMIHDKGRVPWSNIIKSAIASSASGKKKTITRKNRRQPNRLDLLGELKNHIPEVIVAIDISGSIRDADIKSYVREILSLTAKYNKPIRIILCDNKIVDDYYIKSINELRRLSDRRAGTKFSPVFNKLRSEGNNSALLLYFTDGQGEKELDIIPNHKTIFLVTEDKLSLTNPPGQVIYLEKHENKKDNFFGLDAMRELLHEWAR